LTVMCRGTLSRVSFMGSSLSRSSQNSSK
jgi:hypothetical protein